VEASGLYKLNPGDRAPDFSLPGVDGRRHALSDYASKPALVVVFSCNHCPYVRAYEERMIGFALAYEPRGVAMVAINSNETTRYPEDDFPHMVSRAADKGYTFDYLRDEDQSVAHAYGAVCTPQFMLFDADRRLRYQGRFDDEKDHPEKVKEKYLENAVEDLLAGRPVAKPVTRAIGCSIKWNA